jgi:hypothetical protein
MLLAVVMAFCLLQKEEAQAVTRSYTDPVAFYNSFASNGGIWFGTRGNKYVFQVFNKMYIDIK